MKICAIILSAGKSKRFKSSIPKFMHNLSGLPIVDYNINLLKKIKKITKFEIIFLDPPFIDDSFHKILKIIFEKKIFNKKHIVIIHREDKKKEKFDDYFKTFIVKKYGRSKIIFGKFLF